MTFHHLIINEDEKNTTTLYYRHATDERNSSYPFISGDTFRAMADYIFDETRRDDLTQVNYGDTVFLKGDMLDEFFNGPYQMISNPFVLVSHNSDMFVPRNHRQRLKDEKILVWYGSNPDVRNEKKFRPIPIGLNNQRWQMGRLNRIEYAFHHHRKVWDQRKILLYANFLVKNNPEERVTALRHTSQVDGNYIVREKISIETYLENIGNAKFVVSPLGSGLDCHRTWEALLMGAVPIVLSSSLDPLFENLPALIIDRWSQLNNRLLSSYAHLANNQSVPLILYARHWRKILKEPR